MAGVTAEHKALAITARALIAIVFLGRTDLRGRPYVMHCLDVASGFPYGSGEYIVALLHDVLEDGVWLDGRRVTVDDLRRLGFPEDIIADVLLLTRVGRMDYFQYIRTLLVSTRAVAVKRVDLSRNSDPSGLGDTPQTRKRITKYNRALDILNAHKEE